MKMNKYVLALAFVSMALAGCDKVESLPSEEPGVIRLRTSVGEYTKASGLDFNVGDVFGLYILERKGTSAPSFGGEYYAENLMCTKTDSGIDMVRTYYSENKLDFYAYYPYSDNGTIYSAPECVSHNISSDQNEKVYFDKCDFMKASVKEVVASDQPVKLEFSHMMALGEVQLLPGTGMTVNDLKFATLLVKKVPLSCKVNLVTGAVSRGMISGNITPYGNRVSIQGDKVSQMSFISVPTKIKKGAELFEISIKERKFHYYLDNDLELKSGYKYKFEITLNAAQAPASVRVLEMPR